MGASNSSYHSCPCGGHVKNETDNIDQHNRSLRHLEYIGEGRRYVPQYDAVRYRERKARKDRARKASS